MLAKNDVHECCYVGYVDHAVGIDVAHGVGVGGVAEDAVHERCYVAHIHHAIAVHVAGEGFHFKAAHGEGGWVSEQVTQLQISGSRSDIHIGGGANECEGRQVENVASGHIFHIGENGRGHAHEQIVADGGGVGWANEFVNVAFLVALHQQAGSGRSGALLLRLGNLLANTHLIHRVGFHARSVPVHRMSDADGFGGVGRFEEGVEAL